MPALAALLLAYGVVAAPPAATAAPRVAEPACGTTITADTVLRHDLTGCSSNGLVIGADGVHLDLNGHTIAGDARVQPCPDGAVCDVGISSQGHDGLTIRGGTVSGFSLGVLVQGAHRTRIRRLAASDNGLLGIVVVDASGSELTRNLVARNGVGNDGGGLALVASHDSRVERNTVRGNGSQGVQAVGGSDHTLIAHNHVSGNVDAGIGVDGDANRIVHNTVAKNGDDIIVAGNHNLTSRNRVSDAVGCADDGCGFGISVENGVGNRVTRNVVTRTRTGIRVDAFGDAATGTVIERNVVRRASGDGIAVNPEDAGPVSGTVVRRNVVTGSGDDGIDVASASTTITRNIAVHNGDLGIEAVAGVTDGGRNRAAANGDPAQCTGVVCSS